MAGNGWKWLEMTGNDCNGLKLLEWLEKAGMDINNWKFLEIARNG